MALLNRLLIFLFLLFLPTQLGRHFFFDFSYIDGVRVDYLAPTVYLTDIIAFLLIIIHYKAVLTFFKQKHILIFLGLICINAALSVSKPPALYKLIKIIEWLSIFAIFYQNKKEILNKKFIGISFLLGGSLELFLSVLQLTNRQSIQGFFFWLGERYFTFSAPGIAKASLFGQQFLRPYGTFSHPNSMGGFYVLLYTFVLTHPLFKAHLKLKAAILLISSFVVIISFSKTAIIAWVLINIFYLLSSKFYLRCKFCFAGRVVGFGVIGALFLHTQTDVLSLQKRMDLLKDTAIIVIQHPVTGVGLNNYLITQSQFPAKYLNWIHQPVHNIFLLFLAETGFIITAFIFWGLYKNRKLLFVVYCLPFILFGILFTGFFDHYWLTLQQNFLLTSFILATSSKQLNAPSSQ